MFPDSTPSPRYRFKLARTPVELAGYFRLRWRIFVEEQRLFGESDIDAIDAIAYPIIATFSQNTSLNHSAFLELVQEPTSPTVLGVVRIYEPEPRLWYGGRLGTHPEYRRGMQIGKSLINKAVTTAQAWGCDRFLATVQQQNVRFFQRLHWHPLQALDIQGLPHQLMEADLNYYPPSWEIRISPPGIPMTLLPPLPAQA